MPKESQLTECRSNDLLIATYEQLLSDAGYRRNAWNTLLGETADDAAPLRLLRSSPSGI